VERATRREATLGDHESGAAFFYEPIPLDVRDPKLAAVGGRQHLPLSALESLAGRY